MKSIIRLASLSILSIAVVAPSLASAAALSGRITLSFGSGYSQDFTDIASTILYIINDVLVPLLFAIAFIVFLYGVASKYIFSHGDPGKTEEGHKLILWGIIGFVVMISLWGLVNVVSNTFGLFSDIAPPLPYSPLDH